MTLDRSSPRLRQQKPLCRTYLARSFLFQVSPASWLTTAKIKSDFLNSQGLNDRWPINKRYNTKSKRGITFRR